MFKPTLFAALLAAPALLASCDGAPSPSLKSNVDTLTYALGVAHSPSTEQLNAYLQQAGLDSTFTEEFLRGFSEGVEADEDKKQMAYMMGLNMGMNYKKQAFPQIEQQIFAGDSTQHLSVNNFLAGFSEQVNGKVSVKLNGNTLTQAEANTYVEAAIRNLAAKAAEKTFGANKKAGEDFLAKKKKEAGVKQLAGGVLYKVLKAGTGATPKANDIVTVEYEGRLIDGTVFDSSKQAPEGKVEFPANQVIKGWTTALTAMKVGDEWEVYIPQNLAYGAQNAGANIKPFSTLIFKIKLLGTKAAPQAPAPTDMVMPARK